MADTHSYPIPYHLIASKMPKLHKLREFLSERLTAAALEIFGAVEETLSDYHQELCKSNEEILRLQRLLGVVSQPDSKLHRLDTKQASGPELPQTEEPQDQWTSLGEEQQQEMETDSNPVDSKVTSPTVNKDSSLPLHLHQTQTVGNREGDYKEIKTEPDEARCGPPGCASDSVPLSTFVFTVPFSNLVYSPEDQRGQTEILPELKPLNSKTTLPKKTKSSLGHSDLWNTSSRKLKGSFEVQTRATKLYRCTACRKHFHSALTLQRQTHTSQ